MKKFLCKVFKIEEKVPLSYAVLLQRMNDDLQRKLENSIQLNAAEIQSGSSRVKWAEGLIRQLPETHDGRNSWLSNYGESPKSTKQKESDNAE